MKTIAILILAIAFVAGAWGYHYYVEIYVPSISATAILPLYPAVLRVIGNLHAYAQNDEMNFEKAGSVLKEQCGGLETTEQELGRITPSMHTEAVLRYFDETLDILENACTKAQHRVDGIGALMNFFTASRVPS